MKKRILSLVAALTLAATIVAPVNAAGTSSTGTSADDRLQLGGVAGH